jgi:uncharacterized protein (TIGR02266 family)
MDPETGAAPQRRAFSRVPLRAKVRMEFAEQRCFLSEWAVNLSPGGMFVRSEAPMAPGQRFDFEAALTVSGPRFQGRGEVLWVRREWEGQARPPGFAVRFLELEDAGRQAIQRLGEVFLQDGVAAMQQELVALAEDWQRQRLEDEPTGELEAIDGEGVLPDTAVISPVWQEPDDGSGVAPASEQAHAGGAPGEAAAHPPSEPQEARPPQPEAGPVPAPAAPRPRHGAGWLAGVAVLVAAGAWAAWWWIGGAGGAASTAAAARAGEPGPVVGEATAMRSPVAAALPASPVAVRPAAFESLQSVSWSESAEGLWVTLSLDGELPTGAYSHYRAAGPPPREVLQLLGARRAYPRPEVAVGSPLLERIRFGFHPGADGDELRIVFDLGAEAVSVRRVESEGAALRVLLGRDEPPPPRALDLPAGTAQ